MKGGRSFLSLSGSLLLHGLAVLGALALASREPAPGALLVELGEAIRVGAAVSPVGGSASRSSPAPPVQRRLRAARSVPAPTAERVRVAEPVSQPEPSPGPSAEPAELSVPRWTGGESFQESIGGGIPGGGPLAMLAPSGEAGGGGAVGAAAVGPGGGDGGIRAEFGPYLVRFRQRIQDALHYPPTARRRGLGGTVHLEIDLLPSGRVASVVVRSSSSHEVLDEAALETVRRLAPDPFPPALPPRPLRIRLPIVFEVR
jgi:protein TonB